MPKAEKLACGHFGNLDVHTVLSIGTRGAAEHLDTETQRRSTTMPGQHRQPTPD